jgi:hypothetical protein
MVRLPPLLQLGEVMHIGESGLHRIRPRVPELVAGVLALAEDVEESAEGGWSHGRNCNRGVTEGRSGASGR